MIREVLVALCLALVGAQVVHQANVLGDEMFVTCQDSAFNVAEICAVDSCSDPCREAILIARGIEQDCENVNAGQAMMLFRDFQVTAHEAGDHVREERFVPSTVETLNNEHSNDEHSSSSDDDEHSSSSDDDEQSSDDDDKSTRKAPSRPQRRPLLEARKLLKGKRMYGKQHGGGGGNHGGSHGGHHGGSHGGHHGGNHGGNHGGDHGGNHGGHHDGNHGGNHASNDGGSHGSGGNNHGNDEMPNIVELFGNQENVITIVVSGDMRSNLMMAMDKFVNKNVCRKIPEDVAAQLRDSGVALVDSLVALLETVDPINPDLTAVFNVAESTVKVWSEGILQQVFEIRNNMAQEDEASPDSPTIPDIIQVEPVTEDQPDDWSTETLPGDDVVEDWGEWDEELDVEDVADWLDEWADEDWEEWADEDWEEWDDEEWNDEDWEEWAEELEEWNDEDWEEWAEDLEEWAEDWEESEGDDVHYADDNIQDPHNPDTYVSFTDLLNTVSRFDPCHPPGEVPYTTNDDDDDEKSAVPKRVGLALMTSGAGLMVAAGAFLCCTTRKRRRVVQAVAIADDGSVYNVRSYVPHDHHTMDQDSPYVVAIVSHK